MSHRWVPRWPSGWGSGGCLTGGCLAGRVGGVAVCLTSGCPAGRVGGTAVDVSPVDALARLGSDDRCDQAVCFPRAHCYCLVCRERIALFGVDLTARGVVSISMGLDGGAIQRRKHRRAGELQSRRAAE
jgi:hypothetical protein